MGGCHGAGDCKHTVVFLTIKRTSTQHRFHRRHAPAAGYSGGNLQGCISNGTSAHAGQNFLSIDAHGNVVAVRQDGIGGPGLRSYYKDMVAGLNAMENIVVHAMEQK